MSILDFLSGGASNAAQNALDKARNEYQNIPVPNAAELTLPELQQYVQAGILTPAQAQAALQQGNAYNDIKVDPSSMEAEQKALGEISGVASAKGMTPEMQAQLTAALDQVATNTHGTNAAILDQMAQRGIPTSLMGVASQQAAAGDEARTANLAGTQAAGQAEQNAINAMMAEGSLAGQIHGQNYSEEANKAAAENAMRQWNAGATNTANLTNAGFQQEAGEVNLQNKQNVANANTGNANYRTQYNANVPQTVFQDKMSKAGGIAGVDTNMANLQQKQGQQNLAINSGLINAGANLIPAVRGANMAQSAAGGVGYADQNNPVSYSYDEGGEVPGKAEVPGDSPQNDTVHANLSPGELVIPRSIASNPDEVKRFVQHLAYGGKTMAKPVHPDDVHAVLEALTRRRG